MQIANAFPFLDFLKALLKLKMMDIHVEGDEFAEDSNFKVKENYIKLTILIN